MFVLKLLMFILFNAQPINVFANPQLDGRIIGGIPVNIIEVPYQVSIQSPEGYICGGSIIHELYILTAAHCLKDEYIKKLMVRVGSSYMDKNGFTIPVCSAFVHTKYKNDEIDYDYDIAILKLCKNIIFNSTIIPIALPEYNEVGKVGTPVLVTGWGYTNEGNSVPTSLQKVTLEIFDQSTCRLNYRNLGRITGRMMCATCGKGICDSCQGDSGSPLVTNGKLFGIVSWGYGCARKNYPGVYTRVSKFRKWIRNKIRY